MMSGYDAEAMGSGKLSVKVLIFNLTGSSYQRGCGFGGGGCWGLHTENRFKTAEKKLSQSVNVSQTILVIVRHMWLVHGGIQPARPIDALGLFVAR